MNNDNLIVVCATCLIFTFISLGFAFFDYYGLILAGVLTIYSYFFAVLLALGVLNYE